MISDSAESCPQTPIEPGYGGTRPDRDANGPLTVVVLVRGRAVGWWRVLGSNQRRLSRRFYRPFPLAARATRRDAARAAALARIANSRGGRDTGFGKMIIDR